MEFPLWRLLRSRWESPASGEKDKLRVVAIRAVCFDLGGVVARISYHWAEMLERCGLPVPPNIDRQDDLHCMPTFDAYQAGELTTEEYFHHLAQYMSISVGDAERVHCSMLIEPFPGVLEIVEGLNAKGIATGCLSNTNAPHWHELAVSGRFPAILAMKVRLASFEIDAAKPDPKAYATFEKAIGCPANEILLFDDSPSNCAAALARGWTAVRIDPNADPARQMLCSLP